MDTLVARPAPPAHDLVVARPAAAGVVPRDVAALAAQAHALRTTFARPVATRARRLLWFWFRVHVRETKNGRQERVNVRIPIPIPIIGALLPLRMSAVQALRALALADAAPSGDAAAALATYVESVRGFEFVRVEEDQPDRGRRSLVVIGFD